MCGGGLFNIVAEMDITIPLTCVLFPFYFPFIPFGIKKLSMCLENGHIDNMPKAKEKRACRHLYGMEANFN